MRSDSASSEGGGLPRLHLVTDDRVLSRPDFIQRARAVFGAGRGEVAFHLRGPRTSGMALFGLGLELGRVAAETGVLLFVNDRVDVALACGADGAHLGTRSLSPEDARRVLGASGPSPDGHPWIGASVHSPGEAAVAVAGGADFLFAGSVFPTPSHPGGRTLGLGGFADVLGSAGDRAVFGIGGITPDRVREVLAAGGRGVAVLSGAWDASDPAEAVHAYLSALRQAGADRDPSV